MSKKTLSFYKEDFPILLDIYGSEQMIQLATNMCTKQGMELTETNLYSVLLNYESDLSDQFAILNDE